MSESTREREIPVGREAGTTAWAEVEPGTLCRLLRNADQAQTWSQKRLLLDGEREKWLNGENLDVEVGLDLCSNPRLTSLQLCRRVFNAVVVSKALGLDARSHLVPRAKKQNE